MTDSKYAARQLFEEAFNNGRLELVDGLVAPDSIGHDPAWPEPTRGPAGLKELIATYREAFPDIRFTVDEQIADNESVATRWTARGTHEGELWGIPPTGKQAAVTGITINRLRGGQIVEMWTNWDTLGLMQQLGLVPVAERA